MVAVSSVIHDCRISRKNYKAEQNRPHSAVSLTMRWKTRDRFCSSCTSCVTESFKWDSAPGPNLPMRGNRSCAGYFLKTLFCRVILGFARQQQCLAPFEPAWESILGYSLHMLSLELVLFQFFNKTYLVVVFFFFERFFEK